MYSYKKIIKKLLKRNITISIAESCTGGLLSSKFTSVAGISKIFNMGLITYSNKAKHNLLNISHNHLKILPFNFCIWLKHKPIRISSIACTSPSRKLFSNKPATINPHTPEIPAQRIEFSKVKLFVLKIALVVCKKKITKIPRYPSVPSNP